MRRAALALRVREDTLLELRAPGKGPPATGETRLPGKHRLAWLPVPGPPPFIRCILTCNARLFMLAIPVASEAKLGQHRISALPCPIRIPDLLVDPSYSNKLNCNASPCIWTTCGYVQDLHLQHHLHEFTCDESRKFPVPSGDWPLLGPPSGLCRPVLFFVGFISSVPRIACRIPFSLPTHSLPPCHFLVLILSGDLPVFPAANQPHVRRGSPNPNPPFCLAETLSEAHRLEPSDQKSYLPLLKGILAVFSIYMPY